MGQAVLMVTLGVEEEYLLVDPRSGLPLARSTQVCAAAHLRSDVGGDEVGPELLQSQVEVRTPVCQTLNEVGEHLLRLRRAVGGAAESVGCRIATCGAAPVRSARPVPVTAKARYRAIAGDAPRLVDEQLINGMHVHVAVPDRDRGVAALNRIRPWLPVLVALGANSPFWDGSETGFASWRTVVSDRWPVSGPPPAFADAADYRRRTQDLLDAGVIRDRGQLYWQARLSERYPTLEIRALDVQLDIADALTLTGVARALVCTSLRGQQDSGPYSGDAPELLAAAVWQASRYGLDGPLVRPRTGGSQPAADAVAALLDHITPALKESGDLDRVHSGIERLLNTGTGAQRQLRAHEQAGMAGVVDLITHTT